VTSGEGESEWWLNVEPQTIQAALTLAQTVWWVDSEGTPHLVDAMSVQHRRAVIDYLVLRTRDLLISVMETQIRSRPGSAPQRAANKLLGDGVDLDDRDEWMESTPLMRRLRALATSRDWPDQPR
jgi:hypothetical protein